MTRLSFGQLPLLVKVVTGIALFNAWMSLEEFVINRTGVWKYMPYYKTDQGCVWDLTVALLIGAGLIWASMRGRGSGSGDVRVS